MSSAPQRNPSHKRVLKASIRGAQRLTQDECTYYGDSLNQQICKLQIPHQTMTICGNDRRSNKSIWILLNILACASRTRKHTTHPPVALTVFSLSFASRVCSSPPVPVRRWAQEVAILAVALVCAITLLCVVSGRRRAMPPVPPVGRSPVGFGFLAETFVLFMDVYSIHHLDRHLWLVDKIYT